MTLKPPLVAPRFVTHALFAAMQEFKSLVSSRFLKSKHLIRA